MLGRVLRRRWFWPVVAAAAIVLISGFVLAEPRADGDGTIRVMTYNLRGVNEPPPRDWKTRQPLVEHLLDEHDPDLLGVQEGRWRQIRDLARLLPDYGWIGLGSQGGTRDQFLSIFYRKQRFEVLDFDHFWLSDTPAVIGSATWGNRYVRMVTWAKFRDRRTGKVLYQANTHLDNLSAESRVKSARLILDRVRDFQAGAPVILTGDFNAAAGASPVYSILTGPDAFRDTWTAAERRGPLYGTENHYLPPRRDGERIDWILARGPVRTVWSEVDPYRAGAIYASDHHPVIARVKISP
ncbi:endonuclease/exonuclease/phosphatase family protein [Actinomadura welshii]|uniref:endonuclease/exonuclease/phosphatase family protein n=1 Tax=Actinomadura welshii TaxID=3103817 RepID=UPI0003AD43EC|nr:endonuclease/exonuclease/phosphatase family protein [Actinomadura madurae]